MFDLGFQELIVIFAVAIIVFGPRKLPELSRNLGRGIGQLKKALFDVKYEINKEMRILDEEQGINPPESVEPKWKREALEAIYGGRDPRTGGVQGPGGASVVTGDEGSAGSETERASLAPEDGAEKEGQGDSAGEERG